MRQGWLMLKQHAIVWWNWCQNNNNQKQKHSNDQYDDIGYNEKISIFDD